MDGLRISGPALLISFSEGISVASSKPVSILVARGRLDRRDEIQLGERYARRGIGGERISNVKA